MGTWCRSKRCDCAHQVAINMRSRSSDVGAPASKLRYWSDGRHRGSVHGSLTQFNSASRAPRLNARIVTDNVRIIEIGNAQSHTIVRNGHQRCSKPKSHTTKPTAMGQHGTCDNRKRARELARFEISSAHPHANTPKTSGIQGWESISKRPGRNERKNDGKILSRVSAPSRPRTSTDAPAISTTRR